MCDGADHCKSQQVLRTACCIHLHYQKAFFIGSLSTNDWLWFRIQSYFKARNIIVCRPDQHMYVPPLNARKLCRRAFSYKAVANGAVVSYINHDNHLVPSRATPAATYCLVCALPVDENNEQHIFRKDQWVTDPTGDRYVPGYLALTFYKVDLLLLTSIHDTSIEPFHCKGFLYCRGGTPEIIFAYGT